MHDFKAEKDSLGPSICLQWRIASKEKSVASFLSYVNKEKLDSTVVVFGKAEATPPQNNVNKGKRMLVKDQASLNLFLKLLPCLIAPIKTCSSRYACMNIYTKLLVEFTRLLLVELCLNVCFVFYIDN